MAEPGFSVCHCSVSRAARSKDASENALLTEQWHTAPPFATIPVYTSGRPGIRQGFDWHGRAGIIETVALGARRARVLARPQPECRESESGPDWPVVSPEQLNRGCGFCRTWPRAVSEYSLRMRTARVALTYDGHG